MKGHNPEKAKKGFTILRGKANVFRLREQDFTTLPEFFLYFSSLAKFYNRFFRLANGSLAQDLFKEFI